MFAQGITSGKTQRRNYFYLKNFLITRLLLSDLLFLLYFNLTQLTNKLSSIKWNILLFALPLLSSIAILFSLYADRKS